MFEPKQRVKVLYTEKKNERTTERVETNECARYRKNIYPKMG